MYDIFHPVTKMACPKPANGWRWPEATFLQYDSIGEVAWGKDHTTQPHIKKRIETAKEQLKSIIYADNRKTTNDLSELIGKNQFNNPKSVAVLKYLFSFCSDKNTLFLDFFAGSGTTAQAVLELNQQDDGNRHFILCTNNENEICEKVTYERVKAVISGINTRGERYSDGIASNLMYYKTDFVNRNSEELPDDLLEHVREMIQLDYGVKVDQKSYLMIMDEDEMDEFEKKISDYTDLKVVFYNQDILLTSSQEALLNRIESRIIPDCYFDFELREAGELW